ncbi:hypothetical protein GHT06_016387 [Daphnia sinensis]|uniref:Fibronectin type-III domain-containing protein n=1 Tax=Daphnia sinensis TaxID=1820382 RepID=A0AAD5KQ63_9CRUS|nr:hypothetical protein GHT06_016387 [Daphnia sinensis]
MANSKKVSLNSKSREPFGTFRNQPIKLCLASLNSSRPFPGNQVVSLVYALISIECLVIQLFSYKKTPFYSWTQHYNSFMSNAIPRKKMTGTKAINHGVTKLVVLGGHFEMGDFYDYRNDCIVTGRKCWTSEEIAGATWSHNRFTLKLKSPESGSTSNKWENMGLKEHSQASIMAGLIENNRGAAKYLNDREGLSEASKVLICRAKSRKMDFKTLISQDVPNLQDFRQEANSERNPTHVVVGVTYGAEAYCVLALESDENARKDAEEFLSKIARKMEEGLENYLDLSDFKDQFDKEDKTQLTRVKCRLYSDFQSSAFRECGVFEAYKQCFKLIQQVQNTDEGKYESIPIAILLCPLKTIMGQVDGKHFEYHDVDPELVARCGLIWNELDRICSKSAAFRAFNKKNDSASLRQFEEAIAKYKELMQRSLKNGIAKARETGQQYEIERVINIAKNHSIFSPSRLEQWLQYQQAETEMYEKISGMTNIVCLSSKKQLEMELQNLFDAKYTLVLSVPVLDEWMIGTLEAMKNYIISKLMSTKEDSYDDKNRSFEADCEDSVVSWNIIQRKQKHVLTKIREFNDHVEKNNHLENTVQFFIVSRQSTVEFGCRYSVYETGRLLRDNMNQLPGPPTGLRIHPPKTRPGKKRASTYAIDVEWDYEDLGFPCHYLVEYRLDGNKDEVWTQRRTTKSGETQLAIPYTSGSAMTIRVAADTCIGRSEFSEVIDTVTIRELNEDEETIPVPGFLDSEVETSATANNEEERDRTRKTELAATSMLTIQQPIETKNTEAILQPMSDMDTHDMPPKGCKAPDSTIMKTNEETSRKDRAKEIFDHMTANSSNEDAKPDCKRASQQADDGDDDEKSQKEGKINQNAINEYVTKMVVLEGGFQVGDLYDYRNDRILTDGRKYVESSKIGSAMKVEDNSSLEFECSDSGSMDSKMENMGLDEHSQASFMAGLIEKPRGASKYLSSCCSSSQAAHVLICRAKSKVVRLDLQHLAIQDVKLLHDTWTKTKSPKTKANPTHIVVDVTYGAEAYCVLTQDLNDAETDDDSREEAEQYLSKIANTMKEALDEKQDLAEFKQQFNVKEKKQLSAIKCNLYTDFQTGVAQEYSVSDAYKHFLNFVQQVQKTGIGNKKSIPIAVSLCPLHAIVGQTEGGQFEYHDVDQEWISRCARILDKLDQVCAKSVAIRTFNKKVDKTSLRQFEEALGKYKSSMQTSLKNGITKARDTGQQREIEKVTKITENHAIFKPSQLEKWLLYKQGECDMYEKISKMAKNVRLASKKQVEKELGDAFETKYTLILSLPSLDERTNKILQKMQNYIDSYDKLVVFDEEDNEMNDIEEEGSNMPWNQQTQKCSVSYRVRYWQYGQDESQANEKDVAVGESSCRLEGLQPETTYCVNIVAVSNGGREMSEPSETVNLKTVHQQVRFAKTMAKRCNKIGVRNGMDLLAVPLAQSPRSNSTANRFIFGREGSGSKTVLHKTILVMGATGAGKTTLINGMINYIFNVEWEDTFRFQLIREQLVGGSQSQSQTSGITAYDIQHAEGFRVPYSLTIVDTPGYGDTKGLDRDKEITEMIRKFFEDKNGIQNLDIVGFVAQASLPRLTPTQMYIFESVFSIFGKDVEENIDFLLTFADGQNPPILSAIAEAGLPYPKEPGTEHPRHHKFNNSGFFCSNRESGSDASNTAEKFNRFFWRMGMENFDRFFFALATMKTKSLSLTKQVLEERRRLEATVEGLQPLIKYGLTKMEEMRKTKQMITNSQAQIDANENVEIEVEVHEAVQVKYDGGCLTNCNKCQVTCHIPCYLGNTENKLNCAAMDHSMPAENRSCTVCPQKCIWNLHENQPYKWEYVKQKKTTTSDAIKEKYEAELKRKLTAQQLVQVLEQDVQKNDKIVLQQVNTVTQCIKRLDEIALRPNPFSTPQYIDLFIDSEQQEKRQGYKERIESLKKLRKMAVIMSKIKNNENLMSLDRKDDYEA